MHLARVALAYSASDSFLTPGRLLPRSHSEYDRSMEVAMTLAPELKQAVEKAGDEPVRVEDPKTHTAYRIVREDVFRRMYGLTAIDHSNRSLSEFGEFYPDP
jgi:hypothetical protein